MNINIEIKNIEDLNLENIEEIENFIKKSKVSSFKQSLKWINVKAVSTYICLVKDEDSEDILATSIFVVEDIPFLGNVLKQYGGPVFKEGIEEIEVFEKMYKEIQKYIERDKYIFMATISLNLPRDKKGFEEKVLNLGFLKEKNKNKIKERIDQPYAFILDILDKTEKDLKKELSSKTRYNIRIGKEKGIITEKKHFEDVLKTDGDFFNLEKKYSNFKNNIRIFEAKKEDNILAKGATLEYGDKIYLLELFEDEKDVDYEYGKYILLWDIILYAKNRNVKILNLMGFPGLRTKTENIPPYNMYRFKKSFGASLFEKLPEYTYIKNPLKYNVYKIFFKPNNK